MKCSTANSRRVRAAADAKNSRVSFFADENFAGMEGRTNPAVLEVLSVIATPRIYSQGVSPCVLTNHLCS